LKSILAGFLESGDISKTYYDKIIQCLTEFIAEREGISRGVRKRLTSWIWGGRFFRETMGLLFRKIALGGANFLMSLKLIPLTRPRAKAIKVWIFRWAAAC